jgi:cephalosporin-C deacetylase-like acetyl esterase
MLQDWEQFRIGIHDVKDQLRDYVYGHSLKAFAAGDQARDAVANTEQLEARRLHMRELLLAGIGGLPPRDTPLRPVTTGIAERDGYRIEKVIFQSMPDMYVTAHLYIPDGRVSPGGAVLFVCGHGPEGKLYPSYQRVCQCLVRAGLVVLAIDPMGQGERLGYLDHGSDKPFARRVAEHEHAGVQCWPLGDGLARYFIHDIVRAVDYLSSRPEVDPAKIGMTGSSGGGTQTALAMICEPRIVAAAPGTFIMNRESYLFAGQAQDAEQIWPNMSACGFDHEDILLAMAPRPVLVLAVTGDIFPIEGTRRTVERSRRFWDMYGCGDRLRLAEDESPHMYTLPLARAAASFFSLHLLGKPIEVNTDGLVAEEGSDVWCTAGGQIVDDYPDARKVYHENGDRLARLERAREALPEAERQAKAIAWLGGRVRDPRPVCDLNPRHQRLGSWQGLTVQSSIWWSQPGLFGHGFLFAAPNPGPPGHPLTIAVWEGGTTRLQKHEDWIRGHCAAGEAVLVLDVAGSGALAPNAINAKPLRSVFGTLHKLNMDLLWLGDSLAALRAYDVLRAVEFARGLRGVDAARVRLYAEGRFGVYAEWAHALLEGGSVPLEIAQEWESVASWVRSEYYDNTGIGEYVLPGLLQHCDLPDLRGWRK